MILVKEWVKTMKHGCWKQAEGDTKNLVHSTLTTGECDDDGDDLHAPHGASKRVDGGGRSWEADPKLQKRQVDLALTHARPVVRKSKGWTPYGRVPGHD